MRLIIGLGNPGKQYSNTRHNIGFVVIDELIKKEELRVTNSKKTSSEVAKGIINGSRVVVAKPMTFMNNSGEPVQKLLKFFKLKPQNLIVVHDDKDIELGKVKVQNSRGAGGHNGVQSIIDTLGTKNFTRIRVGVTTAGKEIKDTARFVLNKFTKAEKNLTKDITNNVLNQLRNMLASSE
jgi:peptidyl-tRNA hydrolase, PTH1 family